MPNLNKVQLMGNLTRDPEIRFTPKGIAICNISLAINRTWKDDNDNKQEETTFVDVTFFGKSAETVEKYTAKGNPLFVEGRLKLESWKDKTTEQQRSRMVVIGEGFQFLGSAKRDESAQSRPTQDQGGDSRSVDDGSDIPF